MSTSTLRRQPGTRFFANPPRSERTVSPSTDRAFSQSDEHPHLDLHPEEKTSEVQSETRPNWLPGTGELAGVAFVQDRVKDSSIFGGKPSMKSPPLKRSHSAVSESATGEGGSEGHHREGGDAPSVEPAFSKVPKLDRGGEDIAASQRALSSSPTSSDAGETGVSGEDARPATAERNYVWQSSTAGPGRAGGEISLRSSGNIPSPSQRGQPSISEAARRALTPTAAHLPPPSLPSPGRGGRTRLLENRLPSFASLSQRPTSPPPQVARYHAERSFVSGNPAIGGVSGAGRSLAHYQTGHAQSSPHSSIPHPYQAGPGGNSPLMVPASAVQGCPPIHPSLIGVPGSGTGPGNKQQPSFVAKLYSMLEDDATGNMITWGPSGDVFSVANPSEFSRIILPSWFKHANWQSFVRQLNMYGFHKVNHTFTGTPNEEVQIWEFKHPSFRRGAIHLLSDIKRKSSRHKRTGSQSQSFSGSLHGTDFDGRRSRSSTPMESYGLSEPPFHPSMGPHPTHHGAPGGQHRYRQYAPEADYRDPMMTHARVRSLTDAGMRPPRSFAQAGEMVAAGGAAGIVRSGGGGPEVYKGSHAGTPMAVVQPPPPSGAAMEGLPEEELESPAVRLKDLSDRVDAIIRHSNYLEDQVRFQSEQLRHMEQHERAVATHVTRAINRLTNICALSERTSDSTPQDLEAIRTRFLDVTYAEIAQLNSILMLEPGALTPPVGHYRTTSATFTQETPAQRTASPAPRGMLATPSGSIRGGPAPPASAHSEMAGPSSSPPRTGESERRGLPPLGVSSAGQYSFPRR